MGAISATDIISIIQSEIENFDFDTESRETGEVIYVGDGIATIYGIDHAMYGEIVVFDNGVKGMVQDIRENEIGVILFGRDTGIKEGTKVVRTKKKAGIPVGSAFVGRVINALGEPIDGKGDIKEEDYRDCLCNFFIIRINDRCCCGNCRASADGRSDTDQCGNISRYMHNFM